MPVFAVQRSKKLSDIWGQKEKKKLSVVWSFDAVSRNAADILSGRWETSGGQLEAARWKVNHSHMWSVVLTSGSLPLCSTSFKNLTFYSFPALLFISFVISFDVISLSVFPAFASFVCFLFMLDVLNWFPVVGVLLSFVWKTVGCS